MVRPTTLLVAALVAVVASVQGQVTKAPTKSPTCASINMPTLCDSTNVLLTLPDQCSDAELPLTKMPPCCRLHAEIPNKKCQAQDDPSGSRCRALTVASAACPPDDTTFCDVEDMTLRLDFAFTSTNETCCDKCNCYGDPHCESFTGKADSWIICDARTPTPDGKCAMTKAQCLSQSDHFGNACTWSTNADGSKWVVGIQGSPCTAAQGDGIVRPSMLMYKADNFSLVLTMGERSVIHDAIITDGQQTYVLNADLCFSNDPMPWRQTLNQVNPPPQPWLPYQWFMSPLDGGDILWSVFNLPSQIEVSVRCTRTREVKNGRVRYSVPRLNIEQLIEPKDWRGTGPNSRINVGGFCPNGTITKQGSTSVTDYIIANALCEQEADELDVAKLLCGNPTTKAGIPGCKATWCKSVRLADWENCYNEIPQYGWGQTWCAANTLVDNEAKNCDASAKCRQCQKDIVDFGWAASILSWQGSVVSDAECVPRNELPDVLVDCVAGVQIQYEASPDNWVTYLAIPAGTVLCGGHIEFDSTTDPEMFQYPIRVYQCSLSRTCLSDKCQPEVGFNALFKYTAVKSQSASLLDAWNDKKIICDAAQFPGLPNPWACLELMPPTGLCPCPAPSG